MAHKKGVGSSRNGRDSNSQRLGVKSHDGNLVTGGSIRSGNHDSRMSKRCDAPSSMRSTMVPPRWRAKSQLNRAVRAFPTCSWPVGEGAKREVLTLATKMLDRESVMGDS